MDLRNGDCLEILKDIPSKSVDLVFADLPYGQVNCKWDCKIDLELLWKELLRIAKSDTTPFFFTCTTKFGYELITSNKKMFKYDLVWAKSNPCGFLQAKKQPMRKHEMVYVFYKKQPAYDISSHKHKFKKEEHNSNPILDSKNYETKDRKTPLKQFGTQTGNKGYDPPLPTSVIKEDNCYNMKCGKDHYEDYKTKLGYANRKNGESAYDPPLPVSVIKEEVVNERGDTQRIENSVYGSENYKIFHLHHPNGKLVREPRYDPPLPGSVIKEEKIIYDVEYEKDLYGVKRDDRKNKKEYDPPLPTSLLEIKSIRLKQHSTAKPPDLMKWILKYYTKEGDMVLDPTMGSNPMGLACKEMNRNYIGIEKDPDIYKFACSRVE